ncbi:hypothetical protein BS78_03G195300 [Paspalum vaginatum]|nr:hypothetical protein BS78_03G195200 [Paspalum vaginatum]KAJ1284321.1 hypothetical protein BS78_03G195300 [Paspalum vaginatum]
MTFGPHQPLPLLSLASGPQSRTLSHRPLPPSRERTSAVSLLPVERPPSLPVSPIAGHLSSPHGAPPCSSLLPLPASPWRPSLLLPASPPCFPHGALPPCSSLVSLHAGALLHLRLLHGRQQQQGCWPTMPPSSHASAPTGEAARRPSCAPPCAFLAAAPSLRLPSMGGSSSSAADRPRSPSPSVSEPCLFLYQAAVS